MEVDKDAVGLNKKLLGRGIARFLCMTCLAEHLDISVDNLYDKIEDFKNQGCKLFM
jgi:hypothetical protein